MAVRPAEVVLGLLRMVPVVLVLDGLEVVQEGPAGDGFGRPSELPTVVGGIRVDRSPWDLNPDLVAQREVVGESAPLSVFADEDYVYFGFSESVPVKKVMAGAAGFAVGLDGELTGLVVERDALSFDEF